MTSNTKDRVGLVTPGVGLEAKMDVSVKLFSINFSDSKFDSPFGMQAELSLHAGFGGTIQLDFDPGGTLDVSLGLGGGVGGQATYQIYVEPTVSNDIKK